MLGQLSEVVFDQDDLDLFAVDDLQLKADAIKHSILPRVYELLTFAIAMISEVFHVDVLADSTVTRSPNFRRKRSNSLDFDYRWGAVGLTGKAVKGLWPGLQRADGKEIRYLPFQYEIAFTENGLQFRLRNGIYRTVTPASFGRLFALHDEYRESIHTLCYRAEVVPELYWGDGCEPFADFGSHIAWMRRNSVLNRDYYSRLVQVPVAAADALDLLYSFLMFFPVYDSYIQVAKGDVPRFSELIECLNEWYKKMVFENGTRTTNGFELTSPNQQLLQRARELAGQRTPVTLGLRYQVFQRDHFRCAACGRYGGDDDVVLHVDHIVPRSKGGTDTLENMQTLCSSCNLGKGNRDDTDLRRTAE